MDRRLLAAVFGPGSRLALEADLSDADLLDSFTRLDGSRLAARGGGSGEAAFAEIVRRHGPMVWGVCRRLLPEPADAEDAFQATFLALVKSPRSVRRAASLPGWLYGVAVRAAAKLKRSAVRQRQRDARTAVPEGHSPVPDSAWDAAYSALQDEVGRLPAALRTAFLVCDVGGVAQPEAARQLGWKLGTLSGRLSKARQRLAAALTVRGIGPAAAAAVLAATPADGAAVPWKLAELVTAFGTSAGGTVPAAILALATEATMIGLSRLKLLALTAVAAGGVSVSVGPALLPRAGAQRPAASGQTGPAAAKPTPPAPPAAPEPPAAGFNPLALAAPASRPGWEYEFADVPRELAAFKKLLAAKGKDGWEYAGKAAGQKAEVTAPAPADKAESEEDTLKRFVEQARPVEVLVFKRPTGGPANAAYPAAGPVQNVPLVNLPVEPNGMLLPVDRSINLPALGRPAPPEVVALQAQIKQLQAELAKVRGPAAGRASTALAFNRVSPQDGMKEVERVLSTGADRNGPVSIYPGESAGGGFLFRLEGATPGQVAAVREALEKLDAAAPPQPADPLPPRTANDPYSPRTASVPGVARRSAPAKDAAPAIIATRGPADAEFIALIDAMLGEQSATVGGPVRVRAYGAKLVLFGAAPDVVGKVKKFAAEVEDGDGPDVGRPVPSSTGRAEVLPDRAPLAPPRVMPPPEPTPVPTPSRLPEPTPVPPRPDDVPPLATPATPDVPPLSLPAPAPAPKKP